MRLQVLKTLLLLIETYMAIEWIFFAAPSKPVYLYLYSTMERAPLDHINQQLIFFCPLTKNILLTTCSNFIVHLLEATICDINLNHSSMSIET